MKLKLAAKDYTALRLFFFFFLRGKGALSSLELVRHGDRR